MNACANVLDDLFRQQAALHADAVAAVYGAREISYAELDAEVAALAARLAGMDLRREAPVGILLPAGIEQTICQLAVIRAGGSCLPLDPDAPEARIRLMLDDLDVRVVFAAPRGRHALGPGRTVIAVDAAGSSREPRAAPAPPGSGGDHRTHVLYTSGTTGQPKGVEILARGIVRLTRQPRYVSLGPGRRIAAIANPTFDASLFEIWGALLNGGTLVFLPKQTCIDPMTFRHSLRAQNVTTMFVTSALFNHTVHACPDAFGTLDTVLVGGEALNPQAIGAVLRAAPPRRLLNAYGPTECTTFSTTHAITLADAESGAIPIGTPIDDTTVFVLDADGWPVAPGEIGEIHIGGPGVARGYWHRPEATHDRFVERRTVPTAGRLYWTGDLGAWRADGALLFHGRRDNQVKIRGHRIELEDVEAIVLASGLVRDAVATVQQTALGDKYLLAVVVPAPGQDAGGLECLERDLAQYVAQRLPPQVHLRFVLTERLPLTANGKVDRRAVQDLVPGHPGAVPASNLDDLRGTLRGLWQRALDLEHVTDDDDFFALGGDSLQAASLVMLVEEVFRETLPVQALYDAPTPAKLADLLGHRRGGLGDRDGDADACAVMLADARLPESIRPLADPVRPWRGEGGGTVFLTGATGFLGAFLLRDLMRMPGVREVACLVRAPTNTEAAVRLRANLKRYGLWDATFARRLRPLAGDFADADLGLGPAGFQGWAARSDVVFHVGAHVNYIEPYLSHRAANVAGTVNLLRFAVTARAKPFHYVSSIAAFGPAGLLSPRHTVYEDDDLADYLAGLRFDMGYSRSQWVADVLVTAAIARGVPAAIYRPGFILGDSATGVGNPRDFVARLVRGCVAIGAHPVLPRQRKEFVPVDYAAAALLRIAGDDANLGAAYHLVPPREADRVDLLDFFRLLASCGPTLQALPYPDWVRRVADADPARNPLRPLLPMLTEPVYGRLTRWEVYEGMPAYDTANTARALAASGGLPFPRLDRTLVQRYLPAWTGMPPA